MAMTNAERQARYRERRRNERNEDAKAQAESHVQGRNEGHNGCNETDTVQAAFENFRAAYKRLATLRELWTEDERFDIRYFMNSKGWFRGTREDREWFYDMSWNCKPSTYTPDDDR